jgi:hypothetical protein
MSPATSPGYSEIVGPTHLLQPSGHAKDGSRRFRVSRRLSYSV